MSPETPIRAPAGTARNVNVKEREREFSKGNEHVVHQERTERGQTWSTGGSVTVLENRVLALLAHPFTIVAHYGEEAHLTPLSTSLLRILKQPRFRLTADPLRRTTTTSSGDCTRARGRRLHNKGRSSQWLWEGEEGCGRVGAGQAEGAQPMAAKVEPHTENLWRANVASKHNVAHLPLTGVISPAATFLIRVGPGPCKLAIRCTANWSLRRQLDSKEGSWYWNKHRKGGTQNREKGGGKCRC